VDKLVWAPGNVLDAGRYGLHMEITVERTMLGRDVGCYFSSLFLIVVLHCSVVVALFTGFHF